MKKETTNQYEDGERTLSKEITERSEEADYKHSKMWAITLVLIIMSICSTIILYKIL